MRCENRSRGLSTVLASGLRTSKERSRHVVRRLDVDRIVRSDDAAPDHSRIHADAIPQGSLESFVDGVQDVARRAYAGDLEDHRILASDEEPVPDAEALHADAAHREVLTERPRGERVLEIPFDRLQKLQIEEGDRLLGDAMLLVVVTVADDAVRVDLAFEHRALGDAAGRAVDRDEASHAPMVGTCGSPGRYAAGMSQPLLDFSLTGRRAVVCGSTQGIGRAIAEAFAAAGATVCLVGRNADGLKMVLDGLDRGSEQEHTTACADFTDLDAVRHLADALPGEFGRAHILVNNTGGPAAGFAVDAEHEDFERAFRMHLGCGQAFVQALAPGMRDAGYGRILNVISTSVVTPIKGLGVSNTVRGAVANWGRTLAVELGPFGITVNNLLPGFTDTARLSSLFEGKARRAGSTVDDVTAQAIAGIPAGRIGDPRELAAAAVFLASPAGGYVNGVNLPVDGGRVAQG